MGFLRLGFFAHLHDGQMRHVRPFFLGGQSLGVELVMQFAHAEGPFGYPDENRGGARDKGFDIAERDRKGRDLAAYFFQGLDRRKLSSLQKAGREHG